MAIIWVLFIHAAAMVSMNFLHCLGERPYLKPIGNGDIGVDIFFTLSGFLIGFILIKELDKSNGQLSVINFYRSRFLRIWPALFFIIALTAPANPKLKFDSWFPVLTFINNFWGPLTHFWSVAVEF